MTEDDIQLFVDLLTHIKDELYTANLIAWQQTIIAAHAAHVATGVDGISAELTLGAHLIKERLQP